MKIKSAEFIKGIVGEEDELYNDIPQVAFIGRSNVGKSSVINSLVNRKGLARPSTMPGKTREINLYLINGDFYLADLPGYGFAKASLQDRAILQKLIYWYLLFSNIDHKKVVLIIDANIGPTSYDLDMLRQLDERNKNIIIVANKIDKIKKNDFKKQLQKIQNAVGHHVVIPYSAEKKVGVSELADEMMK
jgi:GTP-binding protein